MKVWSFQLLNVQYKCVYVAMVIYYGNFDSPNNPNMEVIGVCKKKIVLVKILLFCDWQQN